MQNGSKKRKQHGADNLGSIGVKFSSTENGCLNALLTLRMAAFFDENPR